MRFILAVDRANQVQILGEGILPVCKRLLEENSCRPVLLVSVMKLLQLLAAQLNSYRSEMERLILPSVDCLEHRYTASTASEAGRVGAYLRSQRGAVYDEGKNHEGKRSRNLDDRVGC